MKCRTAKLSMRGKQQMLLLPEEFYLDGREVYIRKKGQNIILTPKSESWRDFFEKTPFPSEDFMNDRVDIEPQKREEVF